MLMIVTFPVSLLVLAGTIVAAHGNAVRTVVFHEGKTETDSLSSSAEYIPPRQEWFRVSSDTRQASQIGVKSIAAGEREVISLPAEPSNSGDRSYSNVQERESISRIPTSGNADRSQTQTLQVSVNNHGRVGLQNNRMKEPRGQIFSRGEWEEESDLPPLSRLPSTEHQEGRPQSWHLHIRHENGPHNGRTNRNRDEENQEPVPSNRRIVQNQQYPKQGSYQGKHVVTLAVNNQSEGQRRVVRIRQNGVQQSDAMVETTNTNTNDTPPPHELVAKMARYIVRNSNWSSVATISTLPTLQFYPFANIISISDGPINNSSGIPYMYLTPLDMSAKDLEKDSRASLTMSLAQGDYCASQQYDPEDPRCARVILSGNIVTVTQAEEVQFARNAMYTKHPDMQDWPKDHGWFFAKLNIQSILVLDYFGGAKTVTLDDYFNQSSL